MPTLARVTHRVHVAGIITIRLPDNVTSSNDINL